MQMGGCQGLKEEGVGSDCLTGWDFLLGWWKCLGTRESGWFHNIVNALTCELCTLFFSFLKITFIYLTERETASDRENTSRGSGRGRRRLLAEQGAWCTAWSQGHRITPWAEGTRLTTEPPRRPWNRHFDVVLACCWPSYHRSGGSSAFRPWMKPWKVRLWIRENYCIYSKIIMSSWWMHILKSLFNILLYLW